MPDFQEPAAPHSTDDARGDLQALVDLASELLVEHSADQLAPYAEDIAEAYEGLCAVDEHLPALPCQTEQETTSV